MRTSEASSVGMMSGVLCGHGTADKASRHVAVTKPSRGWMNELGTQQPPFFISHIFNVGLRAFPKTETLSTKRHEIRKRSSSAKNAFGSSSHGR
jgi:hypothetical protein